jgi:hypothetical protein
MEATMSDVRERPDLASVMVKVVAELVGHGEDDLADELVAIVSAPLTTARSKVTWDITFEIERGILALAKKYGLKLNEPYIRVGRNGITCSFLLTPKPGEEVPGEVYTELSKLLGGKWGTDRYNDGSALCFISTL